MISSVPIQCPTCGGRGDVEGERAVVDYIRGGYLEESGLECETCFGSCTVDANYHAPADAAMDLVQQLAENLDKISNAALTSIEAPSNQRLWDLSIETAQITYYKLQSQMEQLFNWHSDGGISRRQFEQEKVRTR